MPLILVSPLILVAKDMGIVAVSYRNAPFSEAHSSLPKYEKGYHKGNGFPFYLSPDHLLPALPHSQISYSPPPPGRREETGGDDDGVAAGDDNSGRIYVPGPLTRYRSFAIVVLFILRCDAA